MELLKSLTPAETSFIISKGNTTHKLFIRYTFMDLLLKGVLTIVEIEKNNTKYPYVSAGPNYNNYKAFAYEESFLNSFRFNEGLQASLKNYITIIRPLTKRFKRQIAQTPHISGLFYRTWLQHALIGGYTYTPAGVAAATELNSVIKNADEKYKLNKQDGEIRALLGNNIILLPNFSSEYLTVFDDELKRNEAAGVITGGGAYYGTDFEYFDSGSTGGFDAAFGSDSGSSDSSGDGDSGCSGCSGCGGGD